MFVFEQDYDWKALVAAIAPGGPPWVKSYLSETRAIHTAIRESAKAIRQNRFDLSLASLGEADSLRWRLASRTPSIFHIAGRFYFGGLAFYHFRRDDFDRADEAMIEARESIRRGLESEPCLLPFAAINLDIPLKRARIARSCSRWNEMRAHSADLRETASDGKPLCVLFGRDPIYHSTIADQLAAKPEIAESLAPAIRYLADRSLREEITFQLLGRLYLQPDFFIEYP